MLTSRLTILAQRFCCFVVCLHWQIIFLEQCHYETALYVGFIDRFYGECVAHAIYPLFDIILIFCLEFRQVFGIFRKISNICGKIRNKMTSQRCMVFRY